MSFSYSAGDASPGTEGLIEFPNLRINDNGTFRALSIPPLRQTPPLRVNPQPLAEDGSAIDAIYRDGWSFDVGGWLFVDTSADVQAAIDYLFDHVNDYVTNKQTVTLNAPGWAAARQMELTLNGQIVVTEVDKGEMEAPTRVFSIPLLATDPHIYSASETTVTVPISATGTGSPPTVSATNAGRSPAPFTVRFTGPMTGPQFVQGIPAAPQIYFGASYSIASGHWVEVSTNPAAAGGITAVDDAGNNVFGDIADTFNIFEIPPGASSWFAYAASNGAGSSVTLTWRDCW